MAAKDQVRVVPVQSSDKYFGLSEKSLDGNAFSDWVVISDTLGQPGLGIPGRVDVMGITAFLIAPGEIGVNWQRKCEIARWLDGLAAHADERPPIGPRSKYSRRSSTLFTQHRG
jgi:hypothetical protein